MNALRPWLIGLAAALGIGATVLLGFWQLGRAHQKIALREAQAQRQTLPPLDNAGLAAALADPAASMHRPVRLRGRWLAERTVFLDNRQMGARVGFYVLTPLRLEGGGPVVVVQRGFAPRDFVQRERLPAIDTPAGEVEVAGRIAPPPAKLYEPSPGAGGAIRQNLDLAAFRAETGLPIAGGVSVVQLGGPSEGLLRDWPVAADTAGKNYGYAVQWWAISGVIFILYVWFQLIAPRRRAGRPG